ncbi:mediator of RNA polymerase II transcription subunit 26 isoform X4 [Venturia canescens]|uniref:mediator of RNA polymerase II transcription subunit 26 isoform X4 n=1 Tax=Venturia canescens TaxID=32260 RepID=UPI001C9C9110|nr:mediator of RNA polymerase II transcription subunit 26 isoform X4 [Venturia canescens]
MQRYCTELTERLLKSLDKEYNVVDMGAVVDVITALEKTTITKEVLEITRLGKYINELRRKTTNDALAKRAKDLVRRWRDMVLPSSHPTPQPTPADTAPQALNGTKPQSPALRGLKPHSPATIRTLKPHSPALKACLKPQSPLLRDSTPLKVLSPAALSLHSEKSRSPNAASTKHLQQQGSLSHVAPTTTTASPANNRLNTDVTSKLGSISTHNHTFDAVPRTHSSNKRLRKEDSSDTNSPITPPLASALTSSSSSMPPSTASVNRPLIASSMNESHASSRFEPPIKRARLNGETSNYSNFPYHTTDTSNNNVVSSRSTSSSGSIANVSSMPNQKVPSPRETEKTNDRLSDVISCKIEAPRETTNNAVEVAATTPAQTPPGPKKRGRKKGSKSVKNQALPEDRVKEKLASISRNPKLKTTQELLADLQARGSTTSTNFPSGNTTSGSYETITATTTTASTTTGISNISNRKSETSNIDDSLHSATNDERSLSSSRFNRAKRDKTNLSVGEKRKNRDNKNSGNKHRAWDSSKKSDDDEDDEDEDESEREEIYADNPRTRELTVEEILAKLPPLDRDAITWSDCDDMDGDTRIDDEEYDDLTKQKREITDKDVERLHEECIEGLNGNFQSKIHDTKIGEDTVDIVRNNDIDIIDEIKSKTIYRRLGGKENDREFREWHEMLARPSYEGQTLHILPYVIID